MASRKGSQRRKFIPKTPTRFYIDEYLALRGMERKDLAAALDVTEATISRWIGVERQLNADKQRVVEEALDLPPGGLAIEPAAAGEQALLAGLTPEVRLQALAYIEFLKNKD